MLLWSPLMLLTVTTTFCLSTSHVNAEYGVRDADEETSPAVIIGQEQDELYEMLNTEKVLINTLRHFIESQEQKLSFLKSKTLDVRHIHENAIDREKYLYNPINAVTILKRFTGEWKGLKTYAENFLNTDDFIKDFTLQSEKLTFPTEADYDAALGNLLRIQDMYQLEPQTLSVGEVNGVKLGSEMTWSDCLEIGLKSSTNGYQTYAKYWMETALEKLPSNMANDDDSNTTNNNNNNNNNKSNNIKTTTSTIGSASIKTTSLDDYTVKARLEVMKALLNTEYKLGNLNEALVLANGILELQPKQKTVIKAKKQIEKELKRNNGKTTANGNKNNGPENAKSKAGKKRAKKIIKTAEELMIEEICREASNLQSSKQIHSASISTFAPKAPACRLVNNNLPSLLIQPYKVELLSLEPYVVVYYNVLTHNQMEELKDFIEEQEDDTYEFTGIGQKKMHKINEKLFYDMTGHYGHRLYDDWQVERYNFENFMDLKEKATASPTAKATAFGKGQWQAQLLFNLQQPLMGGSVVFPQLELSVNLPEGSVLYWSLLNEFHAADYRSKYHLCPIISGTQITATASIKNI